MLKLVTSSFLILGVMNRVPCTFFSIKLQFVLSVLILQFTSLSLIARAKSERSVVVKKEDIDVFHVWILFYKLFQ